MKIKHNGQEAELRELSCGSVFFFKDETYIVTDGVPINLRTGHHTEMANKAKVEYKPDALLLLEGEL